MMGWLIYHQVWVAVAVIVGLAFYAYTYTLRR